MRAADLVEILNQQQIFPYLDQGKLKTRSVDPQIPAELGQLIRAHKQSLIDFLSAQDPVEQPQSQLQLEPRPNPDEPTPLSYGQRALWFIDQLEGSVQYHIPNALHARGRLDIAAMQQALDAIVERHEILRTRYVEIDGEPVQLVQPAVSVPIDHIELEQGTTATESALEQIMADHFRRPFDLNGSLMLRVALIRLSADEHIVLFTMHHIASDGWSSGILVREFSQLYEAALQQQSASLPPLTLQYADFANWQQQWMNGPALARQLEYWRRQLDGVAKLHQLPLDYQRPLQQRYLGAYHSQQLDAELSSALKQLARQHDASLFMLLQAAFALLLGRWSHNDDLVIGVPTAGRNHADTEPLIGFFINTLVLRNDLSGNPDFHTLLERGKQTVLDAFSHQDVPLELLIENLRPQRDLSHNPLCQVKFVLQNYRSSALSLPGLELTAVDHADKQLRFDLDLTITELDAGLRCNWSYQTSLFTAASIESLASAFQQLLRQLVAAPQQPVSLLPLCDEQMVATLLDRAAGEWRQPAGAATIIERFFTSASRQPQSLALALAQGGAGLSYQQLATKAARVAAYLAEQEFGPGQRVGLLCQPSLALHIALLGIMRSGAAYVPLPAGGGAQRLQHMIDDAGLELVLVESALLGELPVAGLDVLLLDEAVSDEAWLAEYDEAELPALPQADDLAYVIYTSGSTGTPKGVMVSHRGLTDYCAYALGEYYGEVDGSLVVTAHAFDITVPSLYLPLLCGGVVELPGSDDPLSLLAQRLSAGERNYLLRLTPLHVQGLLSLLGDTAVLTGAHVFVVGGEAFPPALAQTLQQVFPHSQIYNHYGPSEAVVGCALFDVSGWLRAGVDRLPARLPIGRPMANTVLYVVDENAQLLPPGVPGELLIGGVGLSCGYLNRAELTAAKFIANPFADERAPRVYRSGDLARWNSAGELEFIGRVDDQIKVRGYRIEPGEIESVLKADERVSDALVIARGEGGDKRLLAYVLGDADDEQLGASLRTALSQRLPSYMVPLTVQVLSAWPLNANGKLDRRALPEPEQQAGEAYEPAGNELEQQLSEIWCEVLGLEQVSVRANFFDLGGHSLLATRVVSAVSQQLGKRLTVRDLFERPSIRQLAAALEQASAQAESEIELADRSAPLALSFAQQRLWFIDQLEGGSSQYNMSTALRLRGRFDEQALRRTLASLVERHEILRTVYCSEDGQGVQRITSARVDLRYEDLSNCEQPLEAARRWAADEAQTPFDLSQGPLLRVSLIDLDDDDSVLIFTIHHIAFDGWSRGVLIQEFTALYQAYSSGQEPQLPALPLQYADYAHWQRQPAQLEQLNVSLEYWRQQLAALPRCHNLPLDRSRPYQQDFTGASHIRQTSPQLLKQLKQLAQQHEASLFMVLQAAFALLLGRWSYSDDIVMGTPVAGRTRREFEGLIGFFVNTLVLRTRLDPDQSFSQLLNAVRRQSLDAFAHQAVPFEMLVDELHSERSVSHTPLIQIMFSLRNHQRGELRLPDLFIQTLDQDTTTVKFDLELIVSESEAGLDLGWLYASRLFDRVTIKRLAAAYEVLLQAVVAEPQAPIHHLPLIDQSMYAQLQQPLAVAGNPRCWVVEQAAALAMPGAIGELVIAGDAHDTDAVVMDGPGNMAVSGPLRRSGQLARRHADGQIQLLGRLDVNTSINGWRLDIDSVERALASLPAIAASTVVVRTLEQQRRLVAYVVAAEPVAEGRTDQWIEGLKAALRQQLPDYLLPHSWQLLPVMPMTAAGEADVAALPEPREQSPAQASTRAEQLLSSIWRQLLGAEQISVNDNFFTIGGDSILAIQMISRANQAGLNLSTRQLFEHQTIAELAAQAGSGPRIEAPQQAVTGEQRLLPIQLRYLTGDTTDLHHLNQSLLLISPPELDAAALTEMLHALYQRHDALRLRFDLSRAGDPRARYVDLDSGLVAASLVSEALPADETQLTGRCEHWQASLDLAAGPLLRVVHFHADSGPGRLLIVVHHLVVDGVSWRILLPDLELAWRQYLVGQDIQLAAKTSSFQQWGQAVYHYAGGAALAAEKKAWLQRLEAAAGRLPLDREPSTTPTLATSQRVPIILDADHTHALLHDCAQAYNTQIDELLLSALYLALREWCGVENLPVALESHGREDLFPELDVSATLGWFTTLYPVVLSSRDGGLEATIKAVKECCRTIHHNGFSFGVLYDLLEDRDIRAAAGQPQVVFNYLGQFDQTVTSESSFQPAAESAGHSISPRRARSYPLSLRGRVGGGQLRLILEYSDQQYHSETIEQLAAAYRTQLLAIIAHCRGCTALAWTPSDFPLARIDQERLDQLQQQYPGLCQLYPATPLQQGMLYHGLKQRSAYVSQNYPVISGPLDTAAFAAAWDDLLQHYDILRTAFYQSRDGILQVVSAAVELPWSEQDWRHYDEDEQRQRFDKLRAKERKLGFDLARSPLMRLHLLRLDDQRYQLLWTHHHSLIDGWCVPLLYRELLQFYQARLQGRQAKLRKPPPYQRYIQWLQRQDQAAAGAYWRRYLTDLVAPTPLAIDRLPAESDGLQAGAECRQQTELNVAETIALNHLAQRLGVTLNSLLQLAWGLVLSRYSGESDVLFGTVVSGRPAEVEGIEQMVGLLINTIPVRVRLTAAATPAELLPQLMDAFQQSSQYAYLPLPEVARQAGLPGAINLFDSLLVLENYPRDAIRSSPAQDDAGSGLTLERPGSDSHSNYRLTVVAGGRDTLRLRCQYRAGELDHAVVRAVVDDLAAVLRQLPDLVDQPWYTLMMPSTVADADGVRICAPDGATTPVGGIGRLQSDCDRGGVCYVADDRVLRLSPEQWQLVAGAEHKLSVAGCRIEIVPLEQRLRMHAAVADGALAVMGEAGREQLVAYVAPATALAEEAGEERLRGELIRELRLHVAEHLLPRSLVLMTAIPRLANGRVNYAALPAPELARTAVVAPRNDHEQRLLAIWRELLDRQTISVEDNFFMLGGYSLVAIRLTIAVQEEFGCVLNLEDVFHYQSIAEMAEYIQILSHNEAPAEAQDDGPALESDDEIERMEW